MTATHAHTASIPLPRRTAGLGQLSKILPLSIFLAGAATAWQAPALAQSSTPPGGDKAAITLPQRGFCAHRGMNATHPENTLPAFREAVRLGAQQVEFDVQRTKDGRLVIMHDSKVNRTTDGEGRVSELTFEEIRKLDAGIKKDAKFAGTKVPTFEEAIDSLPRDIWINIHMKADVKAARKVARAIVEKGRTHQAFVACSRACADAVREACPQVMICNMERHGGDVSRYVRETIGQKCAFIQLSKLCTPEEMRELKAAGVKVNFFGVKSTGHCRELIAAGVDFPLVDDLALHLKESQTPPSP